MDADNVREVMTQLQDVLRETVNEQSSAEEMKRKCDSQTYHAEEEQLALKDDIGLMASTQSHIDAAVRSAKRNLAGIAQKVTALQKSASDCTHLTSKSLGVLEDQSRD